MTAPLIATPNVAAVQVTGSAEQGSAVEVTVTDSAGTTVTADSAAGASGYTVTVDASSLRDGAVGVSAVAVDAAGNRSASATQTTSKDTSGPALAGTSPADGGTAQPAGADGAPTVVSATYLTELTDSTTMRVADSTGTQVAGAAALSTEAKTVLFTPAAPLAEGAYTAQVDAVDSQGNRTTTVFSFILDASAPRAPTVAPPAAISAATAAAAPMSGTSEPGTSITLTVDDTDPTTGAVTRTGATASPQGTWATTVDVRTLDDGTLTVVARATGLLEPHHRCARGAWCVPRLLVFHGLGAQLARLPGHRRVRRGGRSGAGLRVRTPALGRRYGAGHRHPAVTCCLLLMS